MLNLKKIAVTGSLASGKTTVCQILKACGGYVIYADAIVHEQLSLATVIGQQVVSLLGTSIITGNQIDRTKIAKIVFSNSQKLNSLQQILHPEVRREIEREYKRVQHQPYAFFVAEVPLLYEAKMEDLFDTVIAVVTEEAIARKRYGKDEEFDQRMACQMHEKEKAEKADFTIFNNGDLAALKSQVIKLAETLKEHAHE